MSPSQNSYPPRPVVTLLAPQPGENILDLGCGDGALTEQLAATGAIVLGVDASPTMLDAARQRNLSVEQHDATALPYSQQFDAVFSNDALHWITGIPASKRRARWTLASIVPEAVSSLAWNRRRT